MPTLIEVAAVFVGAGSLTLALCWLLARVEVLDIPNGRSSHSRVVPRGGGLGIVLAFLSAITVLFLRGTLAPNFATALLGGGILVAAVGLADDALGLPVSVRLVAHFAAAVWAVSWLADAGASKGIFAAGWLTRSFVAISLVWMINLYNFMDGIDGLAGLEGVCAAALGGVLLAAQGHLELAQVALMLAGACAGFLIHNWPPAKVFMGDVGSGFLGYVFGVLMIACAQNRPTLVWVWLILLGVFVVDATLTLLRRMSRGERWYRPHRTHAYQHACQAWRSHAKVTLGIGGLNIAWLFPMAWIATRSPGVAPLMTLIALVPLVFIAFYFHAGDQKGRPRPALEDPGVFPA